MKRTLAIMLALIMVLALVPTVAFAAGEVAWINGKGYATLGEAVKDAKSGDTITLDEGDYSLYDVCGHSGATGSSTDYTAGKDLTFIGKGEKTIWQIGSETPDPAHEKDEYNGDYSFDGAGTVTFKKMTLRAPLKDSGKGWNYLGFIRADKTIVEDCTMFGKTFYWGYTSATFTNTTFNCPDDDYALWTYSSPTMTFDNCIFNSSGKVINVYNEGGTQNVEVNFNNCTVNSTELESLSVMNINDALVQSFTINFNGKNTIIGIKADGIEATDGSHASAASSATPPSKKTSAQATCSKLFEFNMKYGNGNNKRTTVTIDGITVWENGKRVSHAIDTANDKYTDGYKDNAFTVTPKGPGLFEVKCDYCGYTETSTGGLYNDIGLARTVKQNNISVSEDTANSNKYKVANSSNITVDYTATMDMENLKWLVAGKDVKEIQGALGTASSPWELLKNLASAGQIDDKTEVILTFTFDKNIDLGAFKAKYEADKNVLKLESDMFEMTGVAFGTDNTGNTNNTMTITCKWKKGATTDKSIITLNGYGLPVKNDWNGSKIDIANSGCVSGMVSISSPKPPIAKVAANQESIPTPSLDTIHIPIVGGCAADNFTLYYGGGSSGDGHSYYYPTTTPVPVIVIPPKTGDMTVWQSILHFLGIK